MTYLEVEKKVKSLMDNPSQHPSIPAKVKSYVSHYFLPKGKDVDYKSWALYANGSISLDTLIALAK